MNDSLFDRYLDELKTTDKPANVLVNFFIALFDVDRTQSQYIMFNKLLKLYSRETIFFAICDTYDVPNVDVTEPYRLIAYFIKKRLIQPISVETILSTKDVIKEINQLKKKKLKIGNPFDE